MGAIIGLTAGLVMKGVDAVVDFGAEAIKLGPKLEAMDAKAQTVFGGTLGTVQAWADANAAAMGLTGREAVGLAANMADLLVPMGFTREAAASMSTDMVGLSGALSEWSGGTRTAAEVSATLQKALLGEREELKGLGISITEADVKAQMLADGTDKLTGASLAQAKAQATQTLIFAKSTDAQAAYAAGTAEGIRTQHEMDAALGSLKETLVEAVFPILKTVTKWLAENLPGAIKFVKEGIAAVRPVFEVVFGIIGAGIGLLTNTIFPALMGAVSRVQSAFTTMSGVITGAWDAVTGAIRNAINGVFRIINSLIRAWNSLSFTIGGGEYFGVTFPSFTIGTPNIGYIPYLHAGGIVPGAPGSDVLTVLQAGERVTPAGGGGQPIVNHVHVYLDGRQLFEAVDRQGYYRQGARGLLPSG